MIIRTLALCAVAAFSAFTSTASHAANWQPGQDGQSITLPVKSYSLSAVTFRCNGATLEVVLTYGANAPKKYIAIFGGDGGSDVVLRWKSTVASGGAKGYALDPTSSAKLLRALKAGKSSDYQMNLSEDDGRMSDFEVGNIAQASAALKACTK